jgi:hypothetical protein
MIEDTKKMSPEEVRKALKDMGIDIDGWGDVESHSAQPEFLQRQGRTLVKLRDILTSVVAKDQSDVARLREQLARLQHGGGS